jgi:hypothetical protein
MQAYEAVSSIRGIRHLRYACGPGRERAVVAASGHRPRLRQRRVRNRRDDYQVADPKATGEARSKWSSMSPDCGTRSAVASVAYRSTLKACSGGS